jgi:hypothetical protein
MLGSSIQGLGNSGYGALYAIPATFLYLLTTNPQIELLIIGVDVPRYVLFILLALSLYAAIWIHRVAVMIFGDNAGMHSAKTTAVINKQITYFASGVVPSKLPEDSSLTSVMLSAFESDEASWLIFIRFLPAGLIWPYMVTGWLLLTNSFFTDGGSLIGAALWLTLTVILIRNRIIGYFPPHIPRESIEGIDEAEHMRNRRIVNSNLTSDPEPRIRNSKTDNRTKIR